jgi:hypothetical protein
VKPSAKRDALRETRDKIEVNVDQKHCYVQSGAERIESKQGLLQPA